MAEPETVRDLWRGARWPMRVAGVGFATALVGAVALVGGFVLALFVVLPLQSWLGVSAKWLEVGVGAGIRWGGVLAGAGVVLVIGAGFVAVLDQHLSGWARLLAIPVGLGVWVIMSWLGGIAWEVTTLPWRAILSLFR